VRYELMVDARGFDGIAAVERTLESPREVPVDRSVQRAVLATMRELAAGGSHGAHRFLLTDLTVAAATQDAGIGIPALRPTSRAPRRSSWRHVALDL
jgi:hypothetical protein